LLRPKPQVRADMLSFNQIDNDSYWVFACSTKLYGKMKTIPTDVFSTDPEKFYYKKEGDEVNDKKNEKEYRKVIFGKKRVGSFRLHIILPEAGHFNKELEVIDNDVIAYVNLKRFELFCRNKELYDVFTEELYNVFTEPDK